MEQPKTITMREFIKQMNQSDIRRQMVPASLGMGYPVVCVYKDTILIKTFFYRILPQQNDKTQLFLPVYEMVALWPSGKIVSCCGLRYEDDAPDSFDTPAGFFRHDAIRTWTREQYEQAQEKLFAQYDLLIAYMLEQSEEFNPEPLIQYVSALFEPGLIPAYRKLGASFMNTFYQGNTSQKEAEA